MVLQYADYNQESFQNNSDAIKLSDAAERSMQTQLQ